ncbi:MAG: glucose-1-phosphate adenylyltransferase [Deltaproteobacteria bacterium RIFOXYA12_FULL_58_15]|nr:MAG: glucose-1-phosphate adenylyltransferase [Deltaproteobacteria bacterium RIFOXYA12_FULL_58_15]OGR07840.1 MAG: glucose-1-phosphate adenylyltransferase [Deltaproteobacteria bacterium RIFOXYB12_FULL_58_9]
MKEILVVILGGGAGTRLFPLTRMRSKPAVPLAGRYRLIDVTTSNCINSGLNRVMILTQYNSASLNNHISQTYRFSIFSKGFVEILAAAQTPTSQHWYQGTADAVRQVLPHLDGYGFTHLLVLSGDHLYRMDYRPLIDFHCQQNATITLGATPVGAVDAERFGIMQVAANGRIERLVEKPSGEELVDLSADVGTVTGAVSDRRYLASMGVYLFERNALFELLLDNPDQVDFAREIIPPAVERGNVFAYRFDGYWADLGTIRSYYQGSMDFMRLAPELGVYDADNPIYTHARMLPPSKLHECHVVDSILAEGCILEGSRIERSVIGIRSIIGPGTVIQDSIVSGADFYEASAQPEAGRPRIGIGKDCRLERTIVDKNARIGDEVIIRDHHDAADADGANHYVRDGIVVIPKDAVVRSGTVI